MLNLRIATALIAGVLAVAGVLVLDVAAIAVVAAVLALLAGWEWARLAGVGSTAGRSLYLLVLALLGAALWLAGPAIAYTVLVLAALWWLGVATWLVGGARPGDGHTGLRWGWLAVGLLLLASLFVGLVMLAGAEGWGRGVMLYAICLVWAADIGAYFVGRAVGRHRLAPAVSAGKTWEGLAGGLAAVLIYALAAAWILGVPVGALPGWIALALVAGVLSVAGDLSESMLKREAGVKDSGNLLPGHGGLLDRIDSLLAALPVMALGLGALPVAAAP